jgi:hypothetical protein
MLQIPSEVVLLYKKIFAVNMRGEQQGLDHFRLLSANISSKLDKQIMAMV